MIVSKIVNHTPEGSVSELTVQGLAICISESLNGKKWSRLQFDLCCPDDIDWIIKALTNVSNQLKIKEKSRQQDQGGASGPVSLENAKTRFSAMRQMLIESGGDKL